jgi:hypothetical protein
MKLIVPTTYADQIFVDVQFFIFNKYDETNSWVTHDDVIKYNVDQAFINRFGSSIYDLAVDFKEERDLRIYDFVKSSAFRSYEGPDINYKSEINGSFDWEQDFLFGRLLRSIGYAMDENGDRIDSLPVVHVVFDYVIDDITSGYVARREKTVRLYKNDGSLSYTRKIMRKNYQGYKGPAEAERRRRNIINFLQKEIQDLLILGGSSEQEATATSQAFIETIKQEVSDYIIWAYRDILTAIQNHTAELMNMGLAPGFTVRDFILSKINYWDYEEVQGGLYKGSDL